MQISDKLSRIQRRVRLSEMNLDAAPRIGMGEAHRRYHHVPRLAMCNCKTMSIDAEQFAAHARKMVINVVQCAGVAQNAKT